MSGSNEISGLNVSNQISYLETCVFGITCRITLFVSVYAEQGSLQARCQTFQRGGGAWIILDITFI